MNVTYHTRILTIDLLKSIIVALPKKPEAVESESNRTIRLISHVTEKPLQKVMMRIKKLTKN